MIINATNIGKNLSGIGRYALSLSHYFLEYWDYPFRLFINNNARIYFNKEMRSKEKIKVASGIISPDFGFRGHLLRLLWTNKLCLQNQREIIFNTSQLEGSLSHKKQLITVHDVIPLIFPQYHNKQYYYFKKVLPFILKKCIKILTVSYHTKNLLVNLYNINEEKISVIYNGISDRFLNCEVVSRKGNYILYVGRISQTKNIRGLINAFELVIKKYKLNVNLYLTGYEDKLNFKINSSIKEKIKFVGNVSDDDLIVLYKNALLLVLPSFYEGFGLPTLEAMACGCPVVVSNVASLPEVCADAAYYVDPYDIESIAYGIYKVLTDSDLQRFLIQKGLIRAKLFNWERSAKEHIKIFEEVLETN